MTAADDLAADRARRLLNQRRFPGYYVKCSCARGCPVCAYTGAVSKAQAKQDAQGDASSEDGPASQAGLTSPVGPG